MKPAAGSALSVPGAAFDPGGRAGLSALDVSLRERADSGWLLLAAAVEATGIAPAADEVLGLVLPRAAGTITTGAGRLAAWLSPRAWLLRCGPDEEAALAARLNEAFPDKQLHAARFTDSLCWLELDGPDALHLLRHGGYVSLARGGIAVGRTKRTRVAGVSVIIIRETVTCWLLGVERSRAAWFASWLAHCAEKEQKLSRGTAT